MLANRSRVAAAVAVAVLLAGPAVAGAEDTTTTAPPATETTTTTGPSDSTTAPPASDTSTTTVPEVPPAGPAPADQPGNQTDDELVGRGFYASQGAFDPASKAGLPAEVARARREQASADARMATAQRAADDAQAAVDALQAELSGLETDQRRAVEDASRAKANVVNRAVQAFMHGRETQTFALLDSATPEEYERRTQMLSSVLENDNAVAVDYQRKRDALAADLQARIDQSADLGRRLEDASLELLGASAFAHAADWQLRTFQNNSHVWVPGFVFPVSGPVQFVDSFGYPRLVGTGQQHWHEGCDVMAALGTPLVAVEDGVVTKVGENSLGGLSLKITGLSGNWYYYAHLSAFAPGLTEGQLITAGTLVGYVGNTGDAQGGPTHLHFELHLATGRAIDAFGLLKSAWQARQIALGLPGTDPVSPVSSAATPDPGLPGGFPRFPDGRPIFADPADQPPPPDPVTLVTAPAATAPAPRPTAPR